MKTNLIFASIVAVVILFVGGGFFYLRSQSTTDTISTMEQGSDTTSDTQQSTDSLPISPKESMNTPPELQIDKSKSYTAVLTTQKGVIEIELNAAATPITVNNFVTLAKKGFYNGTIFHRTIPGFMIQGGDPKGDGTGGPGYTFADEKFEGSYLRGTVAMANAGPNTNGSQFFIMHKDYPLPPNYTIFGRVTKGLEAVDAIATAPTQPGGEGSTPVTPVVVSDVQIVQR